MKQWIKKLTTKMTALVLAVAMVFACPAGELKAATVYEGDVTTASSGKVIVGVPGVFEYLEKTAILNRINEIRKEAIDEGIVSGTYVPMKWSYELEYIARIRAVDTVFVGIQHARANGGSVWISHNGVRGNAENIAWNYAGALAGIEQWYSEKYDLVNKTGGVTGHYTSMINPSNVYVGLASFKADGAGYYVVLDQYSSQKNLDESEFKKDSAVIQKLEVNSSYIKGLVVQGEAAMSPGDTQKLSATLTANDGWRGSKLSLVSYGDVTWSSSAPSVAKVDSNGKVSAVAAGSATITATCGSYSGTFTINVKRPDIVYSAYVQKEGQLPDVKNGGYAGTKGKALRLELIKIKLSGASGGVKYRTYVQKNGWTSWAVNGVANGMKDRRLEAFQLKLTGTVANKYDVYYRVYAQRFGWLGWAKNGESAGTAGFGYRLEGVQIKLLSKTGDKPLKNTKKAFEKKNG